MMKKYRFAIIASGLDADSDEFENCLFEAGCGDSTASFQKGLIILEFSREAKSFAHALISAFADVHKAGAKVERFEPDHLVSLSDIAVRSGMSKAAISLYCKGERGAGFPAPIARVMSESPLWDWVDVSRWMHKHDKISSDAVLEARLVREANLVTRQEKAPQDIFAKRIESIAALAG
jgi:transcriptional regulator with XRE-family HTH domain